MEALREDRLRERDEEEKAESMGEKKRRELEQGRSGWTGDEEIVRQTKQQNFVSQC
jgi:hypothetical protein